MLGQPKHADGTRDGIGGTGALAEAFSPRALSAAPFVACGAVIGGADACAALTGSKGV